MIKGDQINYISFALAFTYLLLFFLALWKMIKGDQSKQRFECFPVKPNLLDRPNLKGFFFSKI